MGRTLNGNVWHFRHDLPDELVRKLEVICRSEPIAVNLTHQPHTAMQIHAALDARGPLAAEERGPAYLIPENVRAPADTVVITKENADILEDTFPRMPRHLLANNDIGPVVATASKGRVVSICYCARLTPFAAEAGVETLEAMQGRGYATLAVAGWAAAIRERGLLPLYSTTWENVASVRVAHKLGMVCYGDDWSIQ
jgi:hypothetical protein